MKEKLTPWFPADVKPVRVGVYIAFLHIGENFSGKTWYAYWDGKKWGWMDYSPTKAVREKLNKQNRHASLCWRGLASNPSPKRGAK